jgi:hypothetical protein
VLVVSADLKVQLSDEQLLKLDEWLLARWEKGEGHKEDTLNLIRHIEGLDWSIERKERLATAANRWFSNTRDDSSAYSALGSLLDILSRGKFRLVPDESATAEYENDCLETIRQEAEEALDEDNKDAALEYLDDLESVAIRFGLSTDFFEDLRQQVENREEDDPEPDYEDHEPSDWRGTYSGSSEDNLIQSMFETLDE